MPVLWCGGEDIDFPNGIAPVVTTTAAQFRAGYARCALRSSSGTTPTRSNPFPGGAVTSAWLSFELDEALGAGVALCGLTDSTNSGAGLFVGQNGSGSVTLVKFNGASTYTVLATEPGASFPTTGTNYRVVMQLVNYGASSTVNVWVNGNLVITFTGDCTSSGTTSLNCASILGSSQLFASEVIVADEDPRAWPGLLTMALTGAGTTNNWTNNTFSNINGTTISDTNPTSVNTNAQDQQYNVTDSPAGTFTIKAVKISARMAKSASPAVTQVKLGYNSGGTVAFGTGAQKSLTTAYATYEQLDLTNPVTSAAFTQSEINALQLDMQSVT